MLLRRLSAPPRSFFLFGPRGTGKSTWLRKQFPDARSYDLLRIDEMTRLAKDPSLLSRELAMLHAGQWVIIDEVQKVPALLEQVDQLIENKRLRFALSGSSARKLRRGDTNMLAGRAVVRQLFPLSVSKLKSSSAAAVRGGEGTELDSLLSYGLLPLSVTSDNPVDYLTSYASTYLEQEIRAEALTRNLGGFARFLETAARFNGQITNVASIAREAQIARQTVQGYYDVLVDTLIGFWLEPWKLKGTNKQVAHSKFYFFDPGVCRALAGRIAYPPSHEERGALLETLVLHELRAFLEYSGKGYVPHYWATHDGAEVHVLLETGDGYLALEVSSLARWERRFGRGLLRLRDELGATKVKTLGVFTGPRELELDGVEVLPFSVFTERLWSGDLIR